jgi:hypothetical protein
MNTQRKLTSQLGKWNQHTFSRRTWKFTCTPLHNQTIGDSNSNMYKAITARTRNTIRYELTNTQYIGNRIDHLSITPIATSSTTVTTSTLYGIKNHCHTPIKNFLPFYTMTQHVIYPTVNNVCCVICPTTESNLQYGSVIINQVTSIINQIDLAIIKNPTTNTGTLVMACSLLQQLALSISDTSSYNLTIQLDTKKITNL